MITKAYSIEVSEEGKELKQVSRTINISQAESVGTFALTSAQFVKIIVDKPTQESDTDVRIYGIDVLGTKGEL